MISRAQALEFLESNDLIALAMEADAVRKKWHPERIVTYAEETAAETIPFSRAETKEQHVSRLERLREIQESSGGISAVLPEFDGTAVEYLKLLALSRIYLDNIPHVQTSCALGLKICQVALRFGADDIAAASPDAQPVNEEQLRCLIREAGFKPNRRNALFQLYAID